MSTKTHNPQGRATGRQPFRSGPDRTQRRLPPVAHPDRWAMSHTTVFDTIRQMFSKPKLSDEARIAKNYPDVVAQGGTLSAVRAGFKGKHDGLEINGFGTGLSYASLRFGDRDGQVFIALEARLFIMNFHQRGAKLATGQTPEFGELVASLERWLLTDCTLESLLAEFAFVKAKTQKRV